MKGRVCLSLVLKDNKWCYDIRFYNENIFEIISSYSIAKCNMALMSYDLILKENDVKQWDWCWIAYWNGFDIKMYGRYVFCPKDARTYKLEIDRMIKEESVSVRIIKMPDKMPGSRTTCYRYDDKNLSYWVIGDFPQFHEEIFTIYQKLIELNGDDWAKYPKTTENSRMMSEYGSILYSWPGEDE